MSCGDDLFTSTHLQDASLWLKPTSISKGGTGPMKTKGVLALVCAVALTAACNNNRTANREAGTTGTAGAGVSNGDKNFVSDQLSDGMAEIELAKVARDRAASADVKQFAQMMIDDHTQAGDQLKQIATSNSIPLETKIDDKHQNLIDKLSKLNGADFDKEYMSAMVDDHQDAVSDLRSRVNENRSATDRLTGKNPENPAAVKPEQSDNRVTMSVNEWAANTLPTVERHLDRAKEIKDNVDHAK
jgi:putative membrane protein